MDNQRVLQAARLLVSSGVSVIPIRAVDHSDPEDTGKKPSVKWKEYQQRLPTELELVTWFQTEAPRGIAMIGGVVSGNLEVIDFDEEDIFDRFLSALPVAFRPVIDTLPVWSTPTGCRHLSYRCTKSSGGNEKLAHTLGPNGLLIDHGGIEVRGEGGYAVCPPSPGDVHPTGKPYSLVSGSVLCIPVISPEARAVILDTCRSFNQYTPIPAYVPKPREAVPRTGNDISPWEDYNSRRGLVHEVLSKHGWRMVINKGDGGSEWLRPGKERGNGSGGLSPDDGFNVFSPNAPPFEPGKGYSPFDVYKLLEHGGNGTEAGAALGKMGYGSPPTKQDATAWPTDTKNGHHKNGATTAPSDWPEIKKVGSIVTTPFPMDALPDVASLFVESIAKTTAVPSDLIAMSMIGTFCAAIRGRVCVKVGDTHKEAMALFILPTMQSGYRKSAVAEALVKPILEYQIAAEARTKIENKIIVSKKRHSANKIRRKESELKKHNITQSEIDSIEMEIARLESVMPAIKPLPQLLADDITPEKLAVNMGRSEDESMFVFSAEGRFFDNVSGIYNGGRPNMAIALKSYGAEFLVINRKGDSSGTSDDGSDPGEVKLYRPALNFVTIVQPSILRSMLNIQMFKDLGFVGRCMFCHHPSPARSDYENIPLDPFASADYDAVINQLLGIQLVATEEDPRKRIEIRIEEGPALQAFAEFHNRMNAMCLDELISFDEWGAKHAGRAARIAGILHMVKFATAYTSASSTPIESFEDMASNAPISLDTMRDAIRIAEYAIPQTLAALGITSDTPASLSAAKMLKTIERIGKPQLTVTEIAQKMYGATPDENRANLTHLHSCGYIRPTPGQQGYFDVNPLILTEKKGK